ncbi:imidazole glycerol phosphate synthase subunit HisH [Candidatus Pacearchaeota archaeon CG10_big_fil_rev_8_21_14_0_10_32_42]|nr:MAG: imidazole glycerol phosphate synthase subunit HisH [Candidatus Pacearchaeota archaeon CG10_big_fil_rev_8_21_14_0_10_32_42]
MIVIIDYGLGNLNSVLNALTLLGIKAEISRDPEKIKNADKLILPGVGAFKEGIQNLEKFGLVEVLNNEVLVKKKPILGICLGMQLFCKKSYEDGEHEGLGWIDAEVIKFEFKKLRVPHMGWNDVECETTSPLFKGGDKIQTFYFVHSYYPLPKDQKIVTGVCNYGIDFCASFEKENIFATQFHPEKSQTEGLEILKKFGQIKC